MDEVKAQLSWSSFPFCQLATATGRGATSHPVEDRGVRFRHYGRTIHEMMLLGWDDSQYVLWVLREMDRAGAKLKSVNFTLPVPPGIEARKGPTEWRIPGDFNAGLENRSSKTQQGLRRACRGLLAVPAVKQVDGPAAQDVLAQWAAWAQQRHFMVFKGVYKQWLILWGYCNNDYWQVNQGSHIWLYKIVDEAGTMLGILGGETDKETGEAVVTLAKHLPQLNAKALWCLGLGAMMHDEKPTMVHCGSTADKLKTDLGMLPNKSWVPDLRMLS